jgi:PAS domain S-box-containing protein
MKLAIRFALSYAALSGLYILSSDWLAYRFARLDPRLLTEWQDFKGLVFVAVSSLIIFLLVYYFERDRTRAQRQTAVAQDSFQQLFERNPLPVWVYDATTLRCLAANEAVTAEYGYSREGFLRLTIVSLHPPEDIPKILAFIARAKTLPRTSQWRHVRQDGSPMDVEVTSHPINFEGRAARLVLTQNITARKVMERALADAMTARSEAQLVKTRFLSAMSHEMRTPLHTITGYLELLIGEQDAAQRGHYGGIVQRSSSELLALIERLIRAADLRTQSPPPNNHEAALEPLFRKIVEGFSPVAERAGLKLTLDLTSPLPATAVLDVGRLQEVLHILLENAVKFSSAGEIRLQVALRLVDPLSVELMIAVCDRGIGIPPEKQTEIFELFTQGDENLSRKYGGTGLGLFVARQLCELIGASLTLESTSGEGSCFTVSIPGRIENDERFVAVDATSSHSVS